MKTYSAGLRLVTFIDGTAVDATVTVVILRARGWNDAFRRALRIGKTLDQSYRNIAGEDVTWKLARVETLDQLPDDLIGKEVYFHATTLLPSDLDPTTLDPEAVPPQQTGV